MLNNPSSPDQYSGSQRQALKNGGFAVNQMAVSGTVTLTAGQYGHDMWKAGASGCTYTFATSLNVTTITITAGSLLQVIEGINLYSGIYTLSWAGTAQGKIGAGSFGASGITGTVVGGTNLNIEFNTGALGKAQFNAGSVPLVFQPNDFDVDLSACQRYLFKSFNQSQAPAQNTGVYTGAAFYRAQVSGVNFSGLQINFPTRMRATPTITFYNPAAANNKWRNLAGTDSAVPSAQVSSERGFYIENTQVVGDAVSDAIAVHFFADARL